MGDKCNDDQEISCGSAAHFECIAFYCCAVSTATFINLTDLKNKTGTYCTGTCTEDEIWNTMKSKWPVTSSWCNKARNYSDSCMTDKDNTRTYLVYGWKGISTVSVNIFTIAVSFRCMLLLDPKTRFYHRECYRKGFTQGVTKRRRLFWLTYSAFACEPKCGGHGRGLRGLSQWVQLCTWSPNKYGDLTPYLTYRFTFQKMKKAFFLIIQRWRPRSWVSNSALRLNAG
jgi:hypothetical protein